MKIARNLYTYNIIYHCNFWTELTKMFILNSLCFICIYLLTMHIFCYTHLIIMHRQEHQNVEAITYKFFSEMWSRKNMSRPIYSIEHCSNIMAILLCNVLYCMGYGITNEWLHLSDYSFAFSLRNKWSGDMRRVHVFFILVDGSIKSITSNKYTYLSLFLVRVFDIKKARVRFFVHFLFTSINSNSFSTW